jgi:hypothetical protein
VNAVYVIVGVVIFLLVVGIKVREEKNRRRRRWWLAVAIVLGLGVPGVAYAFRVTPEPIYFASPHVVTVLSAHAVRVQVYVYNVGTGRGAPTCTVVVQPSDLQASDYFRSGRATKSLGAPIPAGQERSMTMKAHMFSGDGYAVTSVSQVSVACR